MALIPDLEAHGLAFMNFFFHVENRHAAIDEFWSGRGVPRGDWIGLAYYEPSGLGCAHTVSLQWKRTRSDCCDVRLAIDAMSPEDLEYPLRESYQVREQDFLDFFNFVRKEDVSGILSRYGALVRSAWVPADPKGSRITRFAIETQDSNSKPRLLVDFQRSNGRWLAVVQPSWILRFLDKPADDEFFVAPLQTAVTLIAPLLKEDQGDAQS